MRRSPAVASVPATIEKKATSVCPAPGGGDRRDDNGDRVGEGCEREVAGGLPPRYGVVEDVEPDPQVEDREAARAVVAEVHRECGQNRREEIADLQRAEPDPVAQHEHHDPVGERADLDHQQARDVVVVGMRQEGGKRPVHRSPERQQALYLGQRSCSGPARDQLARSGRVIFACGQSEHLKPTRLVGGDSPRPFPCHYRGDRRRYRGNLSLDGCMRNRSRPDMNPTF